MSSSDTQQTPPPPAGDTPKVVQVDAGPRFSLDEKVQIIWAKHRTAIVGVCLALIVAVVAMEIVKEMRESARRDLGVEFGAADTPEKLRAFAGAHEGERLGGIAWLKLGDQAFEGGRFTEAAGHYEKAASRLKGDIFGARAAYGQAMSEISGGNKTKGEAQLRTVLADTTAPEPLRAEIAYQLAVLAKDAGRIDEARKLLGESETLDSRKGGSAPRNDYDPRLWVREAALLRMTLGGAAAAAPAPKP